MGLIVSNLINPFFADAAQEFEKAAAAHGYQVSLASTNFSPSQLRVCVTQMLGMRVAGLAVLTSEVDDEALALLKSCKTPSVFLDVGTPGPHMANISVDTRRGMFLAVRHLVELGHRDILFVRNSHESEAGPLLLSHRRRSQGLRDAVRGHLAEGVKVQVVDLPGFGAQAGLNAIRSVRENRSFTAVICINDMVAVGVYRGLSEANLRIPQDVSVIGFDNTYLSEFLNPPLSTIHIPREDMSKLAVEMLLQLVEGGNIGRDIKLATELIIRESTAPPAFVR
jgi:LacI family transcriptional regulator